MIFFPRRLRSALWLLALLLPLHAQAQTFFSTTPIAGDSVPVTVTVTDGAQGANVTVSIPAGSGDLLGFFANVSNERVLPAARVVDPTGTVTASAFSANRVTQVGGGNNVRPAQNWDIGLRFGRAGSAGGAIIRASFTLAGVTAAQLTTVRNDGFLFGVRIQSTSGGEGSAKIGVVDLLPPRPTVQITAPAGGAVFTDPLALVSGFATNAQTVTVQRLGGGPAAAVTLNPDGTFTAALALQPGPNTIEVTATNAVGTATASVTVTFVPQPPSPTISVRSPAEGDVVTTSPVTVTGVATNADSVTVEVMDFGDAVQALLNPDGSFSAELPLQGGPNTIVATATRGTLTDSAVVHVTLAALPVVPTVLITSPQDGQTLPNSLITVSGVSTNALTVTIFVEESQETVEATLNADGTFTAVQVPLEEGPNTITATATRGAESATHTITVTVNSGGGGPG